MSDKLDGNDIVWLRTTADTADAADPMGNQTLWPETRENLHRLSGLIKAQLSAQGVVTDETIRAAIAAIKKQGPCAMCGIEGEYAAHRLIDSEIGALSAGESLEAVLEWFHDGGTIAEMLSRWIALAVIKMQQEAARPEAMVKDETGSEIVGAIIAVTDEMVERALHAWLKPWHGDTDRDASYYRKEMRAALAAALSVPQEPEEVRPVCSETPPAGVYGGHMHTSRCYENAEEPQAKPNVKMQCGHSCGPCSYEAAEQQKGRYPKRDDDGPSDGWRAINRGRFA